MKKILLLMMVAVAIISCEGPMGPQGPMGPPGTINKYIIDYEINANAWRKVTDNNNLFIQYECLIDESRLTSDIYNNGNIDAYLEVKENGFWVQKPLAYEVVFEDSPNNFYTQTIDFDFSIGSIGFYVKNSKFIENPPGSMLFRVVMW